MDTPKRKRLTNEDKYPIEYAAATRLAEDVLSMQVEWPSRNAELIAKDKFIVDYWLRNVKRGVYKYQPDPVAHGVLLLLGAPRFRDLNQWLVDTDRNFSKSIGAQKEKMLKYGSEP